MALVDDEMTPRQWERFKDEISSGKILDAIFALRRMWKWIAVLGTGAVIVRMLKLMAWY